MCSPAPVIRSAASSSSRLSISFKKNIILPRSVHGVPHIITTITISSLLAFCTFFFDLFFFPSNPYFWLFFSAFNTRSQPIFFCLSSCYACYPFFFSLFHLLLRVRQFTCAFTFLTGAVVAHRCFSDYSASHSTFEPGKYIVHLTTTITKKETDVFTRFGGRQAQGKRTSERFGSNKKALWRHLFRKPSSFFFTLSASGALGFTAFFYSFYIVSQNVGV